MTLLMTGNEFSNVNCKGPQGKAKGVGWGLWGVCREQSHLCVCGGGGGGGEDAAGGRGMKHVFSVGTDIVRNSACIFGATDL